MTDLKPLAESIVANLPWDRCVCTKILSATRAEAESRVLALNVIHGAEHAGPAHFYQCHRQVWHWTQAPPRGTKDCECGRRSYESQAVASKAAHRLNEKIPAGAPIHTLSYDCPHGGSHTVVYPKGTKMQQCKCGHIGYRNEQAAEIMREHLQSKDTRKIAYSLYACERGTLHVAPEHKIPAWRIRAGQDTAHLAHSFTRSLARLPGTLFPPSWDGLRAGDLAPSLRVACAHLEVLRETYDPIVAEDTSHDTAEPLKIALEHLAKTFEAHPASIIQIR